jgi:hypothetical protein
MPKVTIGGEQRHARICEARRSARFPAAIADAAELAGMFVPTASAELEIHASVARLARGSRFSPTGGADVRSPLPPSCRSQAPMPDPAD